MDAKYLSASTVVKNGMGKLYRVVIATTSSGTYTVYDNDDGDNSGRQLTGTITPAAGTYIDFAGLVFSKGLSVVIGGTLTFTVVYE